MGTILEDSLSVLLKTTEVMGEKEKVEKLSQTKRDWRDDNWMQCDNLVGDLAQNEDSIKIGQIQEDLEAS